MTDPWCWYICSHDWGVLMGSMLHIWQHHGSVMGFFFHPQNCWWFHHVSAPKTHFRSSQIWLNNARGPPRVMVAMTSNTKGMWKSIGKYILSIFSLVLSIVICTVIYSCYLLLYIIHIYIYIICQSKTMHFNLANCMNHRAALQRCGT